MVQANIKAVWRANGFAHIAVEVFETDSNDWEFYRARVPLTQLVGKTNAERREILRLAVKTVRDNQRTVGEQEPGYTGTLDI